MQMRQRDVLRSMQNTRRIADAKAENDALRDDVLPLVVVELHGSSLSVKREATTASGVDNAASPRLANHR